MLPGNINIIFYMSFLALNFGISLTIVADSTEKFNKRNKEMTYLTPKQFVEKHKIFPMGGFRHLLFKNPPGLDRAIIRLGTRKILISEEEFFCWLEEKKQKGGGVL